MRVGRLLAYQGSYISHAPGARLMQALKFFPFKKTAVGTMQIDFVANITVPASLQIIFATDTRSSPAGMVIGVPRTLCFAAKTVRSLGELHCLITKQHCFVRKIVNRFAQKSF